MPESIASHIPSLDVESWADGFGITVSQAEEQTEKWWKWKFEKAKREVDQMRQNATADAYKDSKLQAPIGEEVARFSAREWFWLKEQYGPGFDQDLDFLLCYQKYTGQKDFLATPSREIFG